LRALGVWEPFLRERPVPSLARSTCWGSDSLGHSELAATDCGWHLERPRFDAFMTRLAVAHGAELRSRTRLDAITRIAGTHTTLAASGFVLRLIEGNGNSQLVRAQFVVDATGHQAKVAHSLGNRSLPHDRLVCIWGLIAASADIRPSAPTMLEAVEDGWWHVARFPDGRGIAVIASDPDIVLRRRLHKPGPWRVQLDSTRHLARLLGPQLRMSGRLVTRIAPSARLDRAAGPGWVAVGDAASVFDPVASGGIRNALHDGTAAAEAIVNYRSGRLTALDDYADAIMSRFQSYLEERKILYQAERRWASAPFWQRRHLKGGVPMAAEPSMPSLR